jgi:hypothetical protein
MRLRRRCACLARRKKKKYKSDRLAVSDSSIRASVLDYPLRLFPIRLIANADAGLGIPASVIERE